MSRIKTEDYSRYVFASIFLAVIIITLLIVRPFLTAIVGGLILAYVFFPIYSRLKKKTKMENLSSLITCIIVILVLSLPFVVVLNAISKEALTTYYLSKQKIKKGDIFQIDCKEDNLGLICTTDRYLNDLMSNEKFQFYLDNAIQKAVNSVISSTSSFIGSLPKMLLNFFILFFIMFYLFKEGKKLVKRTSSLIPLKKKHSDYIIKHIKDVIHATIYGTIVIAIIQGTLGAFAFFVFQSTNSPLLWGIIMIFAAFIPFIGSALIWFPIALVQILSGYLSGDVSAVGKGIGLMLFGLLIISTIDNILKPRIIGGRSQVHPVLILLGVFGGLALFGFIGLILGPLMLALFSAFINLYEEMASETSS